MAFQKDDTIPVQAVDALGKSGDPRAIKPLLKQLKKIEENENAHYSCHPPSYWTVYFFL